MNWPTWSLLRYDEVEEHGRSVSKQIASHGDGLPLDRESLLAFVRNSDDVSAVDQALAAAAGASVRPLDQMMEGYIDRHIRRLQYLGLDTIGSVRQALHSAKGAIEQFGANGWFTMPPLGVPQGTALFYLAYVIVGRSNSRDKVVDYLRAVDITPRPGRSLDSLAEEILRRSVS